MHTEFLMGNEAMALGALAAGVNYVCGYPGTPSTEVLETVARRKGEGVWVEWSANEKTALEGAVGAAYAGGRALVTMKQMGLNVASDPLMCVAYMGIRGGLVVLVADDPGPISSQTEQDTRRFASFAKVVCFDPSSAQEGYDMMRRAFAFSEKIGAPVFLRPTTRVSHGYASIQVADPEEWERHAAAGFEKDSQRWVIFPRLSRANHEKLVRREEELRRSLGAEEGNILLAESEKCRGKGVAAGGISWTYALEARKTCGEARMMKVSTPYPFPEAVALRFLEGLEEVLCLEELDPVIEDELTRICGKYGLKTRILGKHSGHTACAGEYSRDSVTRAMAAFLGAEGPAEQPEDPERPKLPVRPPVLCAGCPHRASFYAVKQAMKGQKTLFCGDIGCYTLGNAMPLDMVDTCLCMGAGLGMAQGVQHLEKDRICFAFVGDSTFFASALPGVVNGIYNQSTFTLVVLDNHTTAMTGHQPHPGTGRTMMGDVVEAVDMEAVLRGMGVKTVETVDPLNHALAVETVRRVAAEPGVKAILFRSPCIALSRPTGFATVDSRACTGCGRCIREIGCPAMARGPVQAKAGKQAVIDAGQCTGCGLCAQLCPAGAITVKRGDGKA